MLLTMKKNCAIRYFLFTGIIFSINIAGNIKSEILIFWGILVSNSSWAAECSADFDYGFILREKKKELFVVILRDVQGEIVSWQESNCFLKLFFNIAKECIFHK